MTDLASGRSRVAARAGFLAQPAVCPAAYRQRNPRATSLYQLLDTHSGMVAVIQTFGSSLKWNPHIHAIVSRGLFLTDGSWQVEDSRDGEE